MSLNSIIQKSVDLITDKIGPYNQGDSYRQRKCDYIELLALLSSDELYREDLIYRFYGKGEDILPIDENDLNPQEINEDYKADLYDKYESEFIDLFTVLEYRDKLFNEAYPFQIKENVIQLKSKDQLTDLNRLYLLLLCCNNLTMFEKDMQYYLADEFEHITFCALKKFLPNFIIKKLGSNSDYEGNTKQKLKDLGTDLNVPMELEQIEEIAERANKEKGVDLVAWQKFVDNIPNIIIFLVQCACGKDTFHKIHEPEAYHTYFNFRKYKKDPITTLATPKAVSIRENHVEQIRDVATKDSLFLDRTRILELNKTNFDCVKDLQSFKLVEELINKSISVLD